MSMTDEEKKAQHQIFNRLMNVDDNGKVIDSNEPHYPTYARLFLLFELHLTRNPNMIAAMVPGKGIILINANNDIDQVSFLVRHEILHEYFTHYERIVSHVGGIEKWDSIKDVAQTISNIAGDYDISNRGYTEKDKLMARAIKQYGTDGKKFKILKGLVTEIDHPDWINLSFEEMYDKLMEEEKKNPSQNKQQQNNNINHSPDYIDGWKKAIADWKAGKIKL